jgi:ribonucleoside-diphosphate reductase alpha subunit
MNTNENDEMYVTKRDGELEIVSFDKILRRIKRIGQEVDIKINYTTLAMKIIDQLYNKISTTKIDELTAEQCASMSSISPDYNTLAGRIIISNHHKNTEQSFPKVVNKLYNYHDKQNNHSPLVSQQLYDFVSEHAEYLETVCDYNNDYLIDYFGYKTLERAYLIRIDNVVIERPQHMWLRVAIGIHSTNIPKIIETYNCMSLKYFTHATPTLFNAGTPHPQLSSCYLLAMESDSIDGIFNTLKDCALISKWAGGIGLHIHNVRATGSHINGTNGKSNGIVPMLRVFNNTAKYVDQCINPDTIIYTKTGPIPISKCVSGITEVINYTGLFETVKTVLEYSYEGQMMEITIFSKGTNIPPLKITPEHPVFCVKKYVNQDVNVLENDLQRRICRMEWIEAKNITKDDYIVYSIPKYEEDFPELTDNVCYMYGIILSGYILPANISSVSLQYENINFDNNHHYVIHKHSQIQLISQYLSNNSIQYTIKPTNSTDNAVYFLISWRKNVNTPFCSTDFISSSNSSKYAIGQRWLYLPTTKIYLILSGINSFITHPDIASYVFFMNLRLGYIYDSFYFNKKQISIRYKDYLLVPVKNIQQIEYSGCVYDLQMKTHHNYLLEHGLVHNGGGKRNGSFAIYLETWHADIELFLQMRKNHGEEEMRARDLFYALWVCDLFMERIKSNRNWTLMCPNECVGLSNVYGDEFTALYEKYEKMGIGRKTMKARDLWFQILDAQMETGTPYLVYKDAANKKSNQKNLGTIKSSNLCSEIIEYSDENETAVCNLASIGLPSFIDQTQEHPTFNYQKLHDITRIITFNLNRIIDVNFYPTEKTERSNKRHRPIGIGIQGLADVFMILNISFVSEEAKRINQRIFETIYHGALTESCNISKTDGPYETFAGSPASQGILQFDLWNYDPTNRYFDWESLKTDITMYGLRNSLLVAPMPTASTSQILGFNECFEPITSNIYSRRTIAGEFIMANKYLMNDLIKLDLWNEKIKNNIIANNGSIQQITEIPVGIREKYKTVWEIPMRHLIDMAADRGVFICQSQSLNLWLEDPNYGMLTSMHFYAWSKGLKTGIYYLRRRGKHQAQQFTIEPIKAETEHNGENEDICEMCSA